MTYTIKQNVTLHAIASMFEDTGRKDNFSLEGIEAILDYLEETSEDGAIDLDVIAICCDFTESGVREFIGDYGLDESDFNDDDELDLEMVLEYANENTWAILLDNGNLLYINF